MKNSNRWYWNYECCIWFIRIIWIKSKIKYIGHNTYTGIRINLHSKPTPIHEPVQKSDLNYSYSRSHLSRLSQAVAKRLIFWLSRKVSYASKIVDPVINGFSPHEVRSNLHICDNSIVAFFIIGFCFGFSKTSHVDSLDGLRKSVVDKVIT